MEKFNVKVYMKNKDSLSFDCDFLTAEKFFKQLKSIFKFSKFICIDGASIRISEINFTTWKRLDGK